MSKDIAQVTHHIRQLRTIIEAIFTSTKEVLKSRPFVCPSVRPSVRPSVCYQDYANTTRPIILKKFNSKGIYVT